MSQAKADYYIRLLEANYLVETYVNCGECFGLPERFVGQQRLDIGLNMPIPIGSLTVTEKGISADLSFSREVHDVFIPWDAVVGIRVEHDVEVSEDVPRPEQATVVEDNVVKVDFKKRKRA